MNRDDYIIPAALIAFFVGAYVGGYLGSLLADNVVVGMIGGIIVLEIGIAVVFSNRSEGDTE